MPTISPSIPRILLGRYFRVWNMNMKYHSGLMPIGAGANGSAFLPSSAGSRAASAASTARADSQPTMSRSRKSGTNGIVRRGPPSRSTAGGTLIPCLCTR